MSESTLIMTDELKTLEYKHNYFTQRRDSSLFAVESRFYSKLLTEIEEKIADIVTEQFYSKTA